MIIYVLLENSSARILDCSNHRVASWSSIVPAQFTKKKVEEKKLQMLVGGCRKRDILLPGVESLALVQGSWEGC
jgi:hypothetical protein